MSPSAPPAYRAHIADVVRWSNEADFGWQRVLLSLLAMAIPVLAGAWLGKPALGYLIGLGAMLLAGDTGEGRKESPSAWGTWLPVALSVALASGLARLPWAGAIMIALVVPAATLVNYSRPAAVAGVRFIVLLVLNMGIIGSHGAHGRGAALIFGVGALWRLLLRATVGRRPDPGVQEPGEAVSRQPTHRQRRIHLGRVLRTLQGWQYPLRLASGLIVACLIRDAWPQHHFAWIVLSIVLLTPRALEHFPVHITQRAIGTLLGVTLTGAVLLLAPGHAMTALLVCLFGTAAPLLRQGNYGLYCVFSTPVILLAMSDGTGIDTMLLEDRLTATLAASGIVVAANVLMDVALRFSSKRHV